LEDGTALIEPSGVEGYLTRHKTSSTPKSRIYISTHDGHIFISTTRNAHPPVTPSKPHSTPADLFPEVHEAFIKHEHRRMAAFMERSDGCIDLRDINQIQLQVAEEGNVKKDVEKCFLVTLATGGKVTLEAHSEIDAQDWVKALDDLTAYWRKRHRVE
jgi:hypothetical protein